MSIIVSQPNDDPRFDVVVDATVPTHEIVDVGTPVEFEVDQLETALATETTQRTTVDATEYAQRIAADAAEATARATAIATETAARIAADTAEATARQTADAAETAARIAADTAETAARIAGDNAEIAARTAAITQEATSRQAALDLEASEREAALTAEGLARDAGDGASRAYADEVVGAEATLRASEDLTLHALLTAETAARVDAIAAEADARTAAIAFETDARTTALQVETDAREADVAGLHADDAAEQAARIAAVSALRTELLAHDATLVPPEAAARIAADSAETAARLAADQAETAARIAADDVLTQDLGFEADVRHVADVDLQSQINTINANSVAESSARVAADSVEQAARIAADAHLTDLLTAETAARTSGDAGLTTSVGNLSDSLTAEISARIAAVANEATLRAAAISTESATRTTNDNTLQTNINAEQAARISAVSAEAATRDAAIAAEANTRAAAVTALQTDLTNEISTRAAAITSEASTRAAADTTLTNAVNAAAATANAAIPASQKGVANGVATLDAAGLLPTSQLPILSSTHTYVAASQTEMLALSANQGDTAIRTDFSPARTYVLAQADPTVLAHWIQTSAGGGVSAVNTQTGNVVLSYADVGAASASAFTSHVNATTSVHGIADVSTLETKSGAQARADTAQAAAISAAASDATTKANAAIATAATDATSKANTAQSNATIAAASDATTKANAAQAAAATDATTKANAAQAAAATDATAKANNAISVASADATTKANAAQAAAISTASADATSKANAAQAAAISAAAADATSKSSAAQAAAISAAATDATTKANTAQSNAISAAAADATSKANAAQSAAATDATSKANAAQAAAIAAAATDASTKADAAQAAATSAAATDATTKANAAQAAAIAAAATDATTKANAAQAAAIAAAATDATTKANTARTGAGTDVTPRLQVVKNWNALDFRDYFATAGGSASAAGAAINAALAAAQSSSDTRTVIIPPGTWGLEQSINLTRFNTVLRGSSGTHSAAVTLKINNSTNIDAFITNDSAFGYQIGVRDFNLDCNVANNASGTKQNGFTVNIDSSEIAGIGITNYRDWGMNFNALDTTINSTRSDGYLNRIHDNQIGNGIGAACTNLRVDFTFNDGWIYNNYFGPSVYNVWLTASSLRFYENHLDNGQIHNIYISQYGSEMNILNNFMEKCGQIPIFIQKTSGGARVQSASQIVGNSIRQGSRNYPGTYPAIKLRGAGPGSPLISLVIAGNTFRNDTIRYARIIDAADVEGMVVSANTFNADDLVVGNAPFLDQRGVTNVYVAMPNMTVITTPPGSGGSDNFNRADSASLNVSSGGQAWNAAQNTGLAIIGNQAGSLDSAARVSTMETGLSDCTVSVTFSTQGFTSGLVVRRSGATWLMAKSDGHFYLTTNGGSSYTDITATTTGTLVDGDIGSIVLSGSSLTLKKNGATIATATNTTNQTATEHGLRLGNNLVRFDNFSVA